MSAIIKKSSYFTGRPAKFLLSKNHSEIKLNIFFIGKYLHFTYKNTRKKEIEKKIILGLQNGQKKFDLDKGKIKILLNFSSFLA